MNMNGKRSFSVELSSKQKITGLSLAEGDGRALIEGDLGELEELGMIEHAVLEMRGSDGVIRVDLTEEELRRLLSRVGALVE